VLMVPQNCHPDRSVAEWRDLLFFPGSHAAILLEGKPERDVRQMVLMVPQNCHPDRSVAEWRDLLFFSGSHADTSAPPPQSTHIVE
jgi:hypothetical protein